ncbi:MAG: tRNA pseudouridine(55) synthase TruB [Micrococcales bacterium]|nr:tRNA pseudouridine(55) synthase TruB [Micrococcales bacterium]NBR61107.1 tRNA pseudouridine(55) synthase TruB [Actinomycetota bacterium]NBR54648.1 tRNA pseudouridine(55) synthase TruB [Micrococcales bacterium]NBT46602.1 tRNA pseudouridine(55) synthase TruB [Actinomycetota bacterium]NBY43275.1 tRNA pseudouridine(55) synthase TruB [Micrococcales bacterium]
MVQSALLLVDKPAGFTSHDVVAKCRKILGTRKIGHAGTLDPMATGLLVLGVEAGTKLLTFIVGNSKTYQATIRLGQTTLTDDFEGEVLARADSNLLAKISSDDIHKQIEAFIGRIEQIPSSVSAIKVHGERAYDLVRDGQVVTLKSRRIEVSQFEVIGEIRKSDNFIDLDVLVSCSSGTFIRALARDLGNALGVGGHLTALRRTRIGNFEVSDAQTLEQLVDTKPNFMRLVNAASDIFPVLEIDPASEQDLRHGKRIVLQTSGTTALFRGESLVAIVVPVSTNTVRSLVVFNEALDGSD